MTAISQMAFSNAFYWMKLLWCSSTNVTEVCLQQSNRQYGIIGSDNSLMPSRRQATIWTKRGLVYCKRYQWVKGFEELGAMKSNFFNSLNLSKVERTLEFLRWSDTRRFNSIPNGLTWFHKGNRNPRLFLQITTMEIVRWLKYHSPFVWVLLRPAYSFTHSDIFLSTFTNFGALRYKHDWNIIGICDISYPVLRLFMSRIILWMTNGDVSLS